MHKLLEMLEYELDKEVAKGDLTPTMLDRVHKMTDTIKNIKKIEMLDEVGDLDEYSERGYGSYGSSYRDGHRGISDTSYANRKRDSLGRYARRDGYSERRRYSRAEGKEDMIMQIEDMMNDASSDKERQALERCMNALQNA